MNYWRKLSVYDVNSVTRYASGFPLDEKGNPTSVCLDGEWNFKLVANPNEIPRGYELPEAHRCGYPPHDQTEDNPHTL